MKSTSTSPAVSPVKSLLRTPTEKFKKKPTQGLKWPNPYPLRDVDDSPSRKRRVSFHSIPKVKLYDPYQTDSQSTLSDIEVISGKFSDNHLERKPDLGLPGWESKDRLE